MSRKIIVKFADGKKFSVDPSIGNEAIDKGLAELSALHGQYTIEKEKMVDAPVVGRLKAGLGLLQAGVRSPAMTALTMASEPALLGAAVSGQQVPESEYRATTDFLGEQGGAQAGAITGGTIGSIFGPVGTGIGGILGTGLGAVGGNRGAGKLQESKGIEPTKRGGLGMAAENMLYEGAGRGLFRVVPAARRWLLRGGAPADIMRENISLLEIIGHPPRLDLVARGGFFDFGGVYNWASKNTFARGKIETAYLRAMSNIKKVFKGVTDVPFAGRTVSPDVTSLGRSVERGLEKYDAAFHDKAKVLYTAFEDAFGRASQRGIDTPVYWTSLRETLDALTSSDNELLRSLTTPRLQNLRKSIEDVYTTRMALLNGTEVVADSPIPFSKLKELRTRVGEVLGRVEPNPDLPKSELKRIYAALSDDLDIAARSMGDDVYSKFKRADTYYKANMRIADTTLESIYKKSTPAEVASAVDGFVRKRDIVKMAHLKAALGSESRSWDHVRKYVFHEMMFPEEGGDPSVLYALRKLSRMDYKMRNVLLGKEGTPIRDSIETLIKVHDRMPGFGEPPNSMYSRFTQAEMLGPVAGAGALTGGAVAATTGSITGGVVIFAALAAMSPRLAANLLLDPKRIKSIARGVNMPINDLGPLLTRLAGDMATMPDADAIALQQFIENSANLTDPEVIQGMQQSTSVNPSALTGWQGGN